MTASLSSLPHVGQLAGFVSLTSGVIGNTTPTPQAHLISTWVTFSNETIESISVSPFPAFIFHHSVVGDTLHDFLSDEHVSGASAHFRPKASRSVRRIMRRFRFESFGPTCLDFNSPVEINSYSIVRLMPEYAHASRMLSNNFVGCTSSRTEHQ